MGGMVASGATVTPIGCSPSDGVTGVAELANEQANNVIDNSSKQIDISQRGFIKRLL
jgi:hypothetical protein